MDTKEYDVYSDFDLEMHKKTYVCYLEVIIQEDGTVVYAVPSHQEKLISIACKRLNVTRDELNAMCPRDKYGDFMNWLCSKAKAVAVWDYNCEYDEVNHNQIATLRKLKMAGVYKGSIPTAD